MLRAKISLVARVASLTSLPSSAGTGAGAEFSGTGEARIVKGRRRMVEAENFIVMYFGCL